MKITTYGTKPMGLWLGRLVSKIFKRRQGYIPLYMDSCLQKDLKRKGLLI